MFRESFVGVTTQTFDGNIGGRANAHFQCGSEYPGSHLCHAAEYERSHTTATPPASGVWVDSSMLSTGSHSVTSNAAMSTAGRYTGYSAGTNCQNWTSNHAGRQGNTLHFWGMSDSYLDDTACDVARPLACCE